MGGGGNSCQTSTVGHRYYVGMHMACCHGPVDAVTAIKVGQFPVWGGSAPRGASALGATLTASGTSVISDLFIGTVTLTGSAGGISLGTGTISNTGDGTTTSSVDEYDYLQLESDGGRIRFSRHFGDGEGNFNPVYGSWVQYGTNGVSDAGNTSIELSVEHGMRMRLFAAVGDWVPVIYTCPYVFEEGMCYAEEAAVGGNTTIEINQPDAFGGDGREGGIVGAVDVAFGAPDQQPNSYLQSMLGAAIPAFRGVLSFILKQVYVGNNPYIKPWSFLVQHTTHDDWHVNLSAIRGRIANNTSICVSMDCSGSMAWGITDEPPPPGSPTRLEVVQAALHDMLDYISGQVASGVTGVNVRLITWASPYNVWFGGQDRRVFSRTDCTPAKISEIKDFVDTMYAEGGTNFDQGVYDVASFFDSVNPRTNLFFFLTDGEPTGENGEQAAARIADVLNKSTSPYSTAEGTAVDCYGINILHANTYHTSFLDNVGTVPVIGLGSTEITEIVYGALGFLEYSDMNPAHIIRACLTNNQWGMGYTSADIDEDTFYSASSALWNESLGLSMVWDKSTDIESFIQEILRIINGFLYVDPGTGKFVLKLIREDYVVGDLPVFDNTNIIEVERWSRRELGELKNTVVLKYVENNTATRPVGVPGDDLAQSVTLHNVGLINQMGGDIVVQEMNFPGISQSPVANKVAARELANLSAQLSSASFTANRQAYNLRPGDPFVFSWPEYGVVSEVMRVSSLDYGNLDDNRIRVNAIQELAGVGEALYATPASSAWTDPNSPPQAAPFRYYTEATYWDMVRRYGESDLVWTEIDPLSGHLVAHVAEPSADATYYTLHTTISGGTFVDRGKGDFTPTATLTDAIGKTDTVLGILSRTDIGQVSAGTYAYLGSELVEVVTVTADELVVNRGILDTVPADHAAGTRVWFGDDWKHSDGLWYYNTEVAQAKATPATMRGELSVALAPIDSVTFTARHSRPYPPGKLLLNTEAYPASVANALTVTWAHRDRLQQTAYFVTQDEGNIGPETGTTYSYTLIQGGYVLTSDTIAGTTAGPFSLGMGRVETGADWLLGEFSGLAAVIDDKLTLSEV